jgi:hypothetical protein
MCCISTNFDYDCLYYNDYQTIALHSFILSFFNFLSTDSKYMAKDSLQHIINLLLVYYNNICLEKP